MYWRQLQKKGLFLLTGLFCMAIGIGLTILYQTFTKEPSEPKVEGLLLPWEDSIEDIGEKSLVPGEEIIPNMVVDIKGEVKMPGIYVVTEGDRVFDVIQKAGGFTSLAEERGLNLAEKCYDEMVIFVPTIGTEEDGTFLSEGLSTSKEDGKIRVNQADETDLVKIPGIGPAKAQAIIQYREENGPFKTVEDLVNVPGIGEKTMENMRDHLTIP
ncbi:helix-hairpin-helix domain-containing protein [Evansella tamaricis]|uniref:Helix-hairpin-helix domain-containing protein n=1 Tax=Evansella tamaricis TaxID=2069301 RepID=A0ABS6JIA8_9BACI|nr:helix-hairpin-helix domain-containing protein [Evansella tamaricis]MBU9713382.1 helix-hairpin-helix domain-containing protein [Evansella tamaricis]